MKIKTGLTTVCVCLGHAAVMWRCNMTCKDALHTFKTKRFGPHGYIAAGPLVVEW